MSLTQLAHFKKGAKLTQIQPNFGPPLNYTKRCRFARGVGSSTYTSVQDLNCVLVEVEINYLLSEYYTPSTGAERFKKKQNMKQLHNAFVRKKNLTWLADFWFSLSFKEKINKGVK